MDEGLPTVLQFLYHSVGLQNVNDSNEQQEALSFTSHSWNTTHSVIMIQSVPACGASLYRLHCGGIQGSLSCGLLFIPTACRWALGLMLSLSLCLVVDPKQQTVVHDLKTLQHQTVSLQGFDQSAVCVLVQSEALGNITQKVQVFKSGFGLLPLLLGCSPLVSGAFQVKLEVHAYRAR